MSDIETTAPTVGLLRYDNVDELEYALAKRFFGVRPKNVANWYNLKILPSSGARARDDIGLRKTDLNHIDYLVLPGYIAGKPKPNSSLMKFLRLAYREHVCHVCLGSAINLLCESGIDIKRRVVVNSSDASRLKKCYPNLELDAQSLYLRDELICTSSGLTASVDLLLSIIAQDFGAAASNEFANTLALTNHRFADQRQYVKQPYSQSRQNFNRTLDWAVKNLHLNNLARRMAEEAGMTRRTLHRKFISRLGVSPTEWITRKRIDTAAQQLSETDSSIKRIAHRVGFASEPSFRKRFKKITGFTAAQYRAAYSKKVNCSSTGCVKTSINR